MLGPMRRNGGKSSSGIVFRSDFDKHVVLSAFERRGWHRMREEDDEWDIYWASVHSIRQLFNPETGRRLAEHQLVNHFPNHYELTRKDLMYRNIRRYRKEYGKLQSEHLQGTAGTVADDRLGGERAFLDDLPPEWVPTTFALPNDYALFVEEFRRDPSATWIAKPTGKSQGRGIFLVSRLQQLKKWSNTQKTPFSQPMPFRDPYIISRYIDDPLLVGGKKFDMRLYVLVTSYRPLKAYLYRSGFCRFCVEQYTSDVAEFDNVFVHLTNVAIQKQADDYNDRHGGKWDVNDLMLFIESTRGREARERLLTGMDSIIVYSLKAVQSVMVNDKHCFEMYGFDILVDKNLKPWLLEVNASPSLTTTTEEDRLLKLRLINDVLNVVMPPRPHGTLAGDSELNLGGFICLLDEALQRQREEERREQSSRDRRRSGSRLGSSWR